MNSDQIIKSLPKTDLHLHLDGSLRLESLIEMAKSMKIKLPSFTVEGLQELVFKDRYESLVEYLQGFQYTCAVMRDLENIERISYELAKDNQGEGVYYIETRFAPQLLMNNSNLSMKEVLDACHRGMDLAKNEFNSKLGEDDLTFDYGIIACAMRNFGPEYSPYYEDLFKRNSKNTKNDVLKIAALELAKEVVSIRDEHGIPVVGFDLAGQEDGYPAVDFKKAYDFVHHNFMHKTVHAGEAYGAESIFQALTDLHADRIGHGYYLFDEAKITFPKLNAKEYIRNLSSFLAEKRITIEVCLTSNFQTNPNLNDLKNHTMKKMLEHKVPVTICTDNRLVSRTTVSNEWKLAIESFNLSEEQIKDIAIYGFKRSFFPGHYDRKDEYVQKAITKIQNSF